MNLSVLNGVFPSRLKRAKIVPIYKDNDVLLSNFSKIFEKLMYKRLKIFFEKSFVLYEKTCSMDLETGIQHNMHL